MSGILVAMLVLQLVRVALHNMPPRRGLNVLRLFLGGAILLGGGFTMQVVPLVAPALLLMVLLFAAPWLVARRVLIPLGLARMAYWTSRLADVTFGLDPHGGAAVAGAWAVCRQRKVDEETVAWLEAKLDAQTPLRGGGVLASGLLLAARNDLDGARILIEAVSGIDHRAVPPVVRRIASGWLAADAARRGD